MRVHLYVLSIINQCLSEELYLGLILYMTTDLHIDLYLAYIFILTQPYKTMDLFEVSCLVFGKIFQSMNMELTTGKHSHPVFKEHIIYTLINGKLLKLLIN